MRIGYFKHWFQPPYKFVDFLREQGFAAEAIDYTRKGYLEPFDVALIEQNGFNDFIENDELYIRDWVGRGGILLFMHQDYCRWAPYFLPPELGYTQLIHRYVPTINHDGSAEDPYMCYLMPWHEKQNAAGLFSVPEKISPDEMLDWKIRVNSFRVVKNPEGFSSTETARTAALSCFLANPAWEIIGSYMDPAVRDGALILQGRYGKGMYFLNQLLFPEEITPEAERCLDFWKKYLRNLFAYFERFKQGIPEPAVGEKKDLPVRKNYKMAIHMHSLDWFGCDASPGTIHALMRYMGFDICALSVKDSAPYDGGLDPARYSDDHVLFLDGQEYHPFNWTEINRKCGHNTYHALAMGIDPDFYTQEFTRSLFSEPEIDSYLKRAVRYVHDHHGAVCATHPRCDCWYDYDFDAVDMEPLKTLAGSDIERFWLSGRKIAMMVSVDLFGTRRMYDNPAVNFIYLQGEKPCRDSVVRAVRAHHTVAAVWFREADITLGDHLPGDELSQAEAADSVLNIAAEISIGKIRQVRVYSGADVIWSAEPDSARIDLHLPLKNLPLKGFVRVEAEGETPLRILASTPFFLN